MPCAFPAAPSLPSLFDHLPKDALIVDLEPERQLAEVRELENETTGLTEAEAVDHELPSGFRPPMVPVDRLLAGGWERVRITAGESEEGIDLGWRQPEPIVRRPAALNQLLAERQSVVLATEQSERLEALLAEAGRRGQPVELDLDLDALLPPGLLHGDADLPVGADNPGLGIAVLSDHELFGRVRRPATRRGGAGKSLPTVSLEFQPGELVVHVDHGVSRFQGMVLKELDGAEREYLELEYAEGDRLFVPVEFLDRVQKYLGGSDGEPPLNRLGTGAWEKARSRAKRSVEDIAVSGLTLAKLTVAANLLGDLVKS